MNEYLIMCRSLTNAQHCKRILEAALIKAFVTKAPHALTSAGCGYAVRVHGKVTEAARLIKAKGLLTGKVYSVGRNGEYTEVGL